MRQSSHGFNRRETDGIMSKIAWLVHEKLVAYKGLKNY